MKNRDIYKEAHHVQNYFHFNLLIIKLKKFRGSKILTQNTWNMGLNFFNNITTNIFVYTVLVLQH